MNSTVDLHLHTTASDGTDSPQELLEHLLERGIRTFSVTDHDTEAGALEMERLTAGRDDLAYYRGIEFTCVTEVRECHILGYLYRPDSPRFLSLLEKGRELRAEKMRRRIGILRDQYHIEFTEAQMKWLVSRESAGRPHLARLIMEDGYTSSLDEAFAILKEIKTPNDKLDAAEAVAGITAAGGIPVWAHPLGGEGARRMTPPEFDRQFSILRGAGIRGLECCYSRYTGEESGFLRRLAVRNGLLISGGSDYHGKVKTISPGTLCAEQTPVNPADLTILQELRKIQAERQKQDRNHTAAGNPPVMKAASAGPEQTVHPEAEGEFQ